MQWLHQKQHVASAQVEKISDSWEVGQNGAKFKN